MGVGRRRTLAEPLGPEVEREDTEIHFVSTFSFVFGKKKPVLCHSCVSICFISHSGSFELWSVLDSDFGGGGLWTPREGLKGEPHILISLK